MADISGTGHLRVYSYAPVIARVRKLTVDIKAVFSVFIETFSYSLERWIHKAAGLT